jgi:hypothetical protein
MYFVRATRMDLLIFLLGVALERGELMMNVMMEVETMEQMAEYLKGLVVMASRFWEVELASSLLVEGIISKSLVGGMLQGMIAYPSTY